MSPVPDTVIVDLRQPEDYDQFSLPGSVSFPLVQAGGPSVFSNAKLLASLWRELGVSLGSESEEICSQIRGKRSLIICYDGDSARVATSVLRAKGYAADSMGGGIKALHRLDSQLEGCVRQPRAESLTGHLLSPISQ